MVSAAHGNRNGRPGISGAGALAAGGGGRGPTRWTRPQPTTPASSLAQLRVQGRGPSSLSCTAMLRRIVERIGRVGCVDGGGGGVVPGSCSMSLRGKENVTT